MEMTTEKMIEKWKGKDRLEGGGGKGTEVIEMKGENCLFKPKQL